jgi:hypothetical protein
VRALDYDLAEPRIALAGRAVTTVPRPLLDVDRREAVFGLAQRGMAGAALACRHPFRE